LKGMEGPVHDSIAIKEHEAGLIHRVIITEEEGVGRGTVKWFLSAFP
jgi:hypothetical protein